MRIFSYAFIFWPKLGAPTKDFVEPASNLLEGEKCLLRLWK